MPEKQVLLSGDGHSWITLDYRDDDEPCVRWSDVESNEDVLVAENFEEFLQGLISNDNYVNE